MAVTYLAMLSVAHAEVRLPHILSDHAVLQRESPLRIWGWADPGEQVTVSFHNQKETVTADHIGKWSVALGPEQAGGPYTLTVAGSATAQPVVRQDILVGDVWFASGQSNMQFPLTGFGAMAPLKNGAEEIAHSATDGVRLLLWSDQASDYPLDDRDASWTLCTPETAQNFSAVAFFFGREIHNREHVPIGLIDSSWGGTPIAAWLSLEGLSQTDATLPTLSWRAHMMDTQADVPLLEAEAKRQDAEAAAQGKPAPQHPWHPPVAAYGPAELFNGMVAPATRYGIKGVIWYQGETDSNEARAPLYEKLLPAMIADWRGWWREGNFPFLFIQISSFNSPGESWPTIREADRRSLKVANTAMVVTTDVGQADNVHPADKQTVAARLALAARATVYGEHVEYAGPMFREAGVAPGGMRVWFDHSDGLRAGRQAAGGTLAGFELAGEDGQFHKAAARVERLNGVDTVLVTSSEVQAPREVRYAWANVALDANLYNSAGLPASPFTSQQQIPPPCAASLHIPCP